MPCDVSGALQLFIAPMFPGAIPTTVRAEQVAQEAKLQKFEANTYVWRESDGMSKALQKHIIAAADDVYIKAKKYSKMTVNQLVVHLFIQPIWRHQPQQYHGQ
jgi:hypothetical protein